MAHTFKISSVDTVFDQASTSYVLDVAIEVFEGEELAFTRRFSYPLETSADFIKEDLAKVCSTLDSDKVIASQSAELESKLANAELTKQSLMSE